MLDHAGEWRDLMQSRSAGLRFVWYSKSLTNVELSERGSDFDQGSYWLRNWHVLTKVGFEARIRSMFS